MLLPALLLAACDGTRRDAGTASSSPQLAPTAPIRAPQPDANAPALSPYTRVPDSRDGIGKAYMGREIAGVMGYEGAAWLERAERAREEGSEALVQGLALRPGMVVADVGAGTGYYARRFARAVGPSGRVYAVDVQPEMLALLRGLAEKEGFGNIEPVLGRPDAVPLPADSVDVAVMVDVYHELEYPAETLASLVRTLKPEGRIVFVEFRAEDEAVPIKRMHKMSVAQIEREARAAGLVPERAVPGLPWQHALVFRRGAPAAAGIGR